MFKRILFAIGLCLVAAVCVFVWNDGSPHLAKLEQCPKVVAPSVTADLDSRSGYQAATSAFLVTYGGSLHGIRRMKKVDIKYPDGFSFTFDVSWREANGLEVVLANPTLNESTSKDANRCAA